MSNSSFFSIIEKYFCRNGGWTRLKGELAVYYWPQLAGSELARKTAAVRYRDGFLYLQTESPALAHQLLLMSPDILKKFQLLLGKGILKGIKVRVGTVKSATSPAEPVIPDSRLTPAETGIIDECSSRILDPQLAAKFASLMKMVFLDRKYKKAKGGKECRSCGVIIDNDFNYCPSCEFEVNEEIKAYRKYQIKHNLGANQDDPSELTGLNQILFKNNH